jgi:predicted transcriptional regulator
MIRRVAVIPSDSDFYFQNALVGHVCSHPLIAAYIGLSVQNAAEIMAENKIRKLPIKSSSANHLKGMIVVIYPSIFIIACCHHE